MRGSRSIRAAALAALGAAMLCGPGAATAAAEPLPGTCAWPVKSDPDALNVAFPDASATYWGSTFLPGSRLVIEGRYPRARYFSFHAYDAASRPVGSLADFEIRPEPGSRNPFRNRDARPGGRYRVFVEPTAPPAEPRPNTLYAGATEEGLPNPAGVLLYRVYAPRDPGQPAGGVLPRITVELPGGAELELGECRPLPPPGDGALNEAIAAAGYPEGLPAPPYPLADDPPSWGIFRGLVGSGGFFSNQQVGAYGALHVSREHGGLVVIRGKAPRFPNTGAGQSPAKRRTDVRYWSICMNELVSQRFLDCTADSETPLSPRRRFTLVISDAAHRPANATRAQGVVWLPWGPTPDGLLLYRHILAKPRFRQAWSAIPPGADLVEAMGAYYPRAVYCTSERFESGGWRACRG